MKRLAARGKCQIMNVFEAVAHIFAYSNACVQLLARTESHPWTCNQGCNQIAEKGCGQIEKG